MPKHVAASAAQRRLVTPLSTPTPLLRYHQGMKPETQTSKAMTKTLQAVYENGVLRPLEPVNLPENAKVTVTIADASETVTEEASLGGEVHAEASGTKPPKTAGPAKAACRSACSPEPKNSDP